MTVSIDQLTKSPHQLGQFQANLFVFIIWHGAGNVNTVISFTRERVSDVTYARSALKHHCPAHWENLVATSTKAVKE